MEKTEKKRSRAMYWLFTVLSGAGTILLVMFYSQFFWLGLPFFFTSFMLALDYL